MASKVVKRKRRALDPPASLNEAAAARWRAVAPELSKRGPIDGVTLAAYCQVWVRWQEAEAAIAKSGTLVKTPGGRSVSNPYLAVSRQASREVRALEDRLGLGAVRMSDSVVVDTDGLVTRRQLAELLGVHMQTVTKWEQDGMPIAKRGRKGRASQYKPSAVREWLAAREEAATTGGTFDVAQERAKKERWQGLLAEQTFKVRERQLLPAADVERVWSARIVAARNVLLSAVASHADAVYRAAAVDGLAGVDRELKAMVYAALTELSVMRQDDAGTGEAVA